MNVQDLPKIETQFNVSINLYGHSDSNIYPIQTTQSTAEKHVDLLVTLNSETNHYIWIKNFNRLCYKVTKHKAKKFFCKHCIQHFASEFVSQKHKKDCMLLTKCQAIEMPAESRVTKFKFLLLSMLIWKHYYSNWLVLKCKKRNMIKQRNYKNM